MSVRHVKELQAIVMGEFHLPIHELLKLPDNLNLAPDQSAACDFTGGPNSAPPYLGPSHPVVVNGTTTYVYAWSDAHESAFFKLQ